MSVYGPPHSEPRPPKVIPLPTGELLVEGVDFVVESGRVKFLEPRPWKRADALNHPDGRAKP